MGPFKNDITRERRGQKRWLTLFQIAAERGRCGNGHFCGDIIFEWPISRYRNNFETNRQIWARLATFALLISLFLHLTILIRLTLQPVLQLSLQLNLSNWYWAKLVVKDSSSIFFKFFYGVYFQYPQLSLNGHIFQLVQLGRGVSLCSAELLAVGSDVNTDFTMDNATTSTTTKSCYFQSPYLLKK